MSGYNSPKKKQVIDIWYIFLHKIKVSRVPCWLVPIDFHCIDKNSWIMIPEYKFLGELCL